jgi:hypothetical protein
MNNTDYFRRHIGEYCGNEYYRFKVIESGELSFLVIIHRKKTVIDLYEEVDLRVNGDTGARQFQLTTVRNDPDSALAFDTTPLDELIPLLISSGRLSSVQSVPLVFEILMEHLGIPPR